jgi:hypothetical protein
MASSGTLRRVALVRTDVSEEPRASLIRVTRIGELGTTLAVTSNRRTLRGVRRVRVAVGMGGSLVAFSWCVQRLWVVLSAVTHQTNRPTSSAEYGNSDMSCNDSHVALLKDMCLRLPRYLSAFHVQLLSVVEL